MLIEPAAFGAHHWSRQSFENEINNSIGKYYAAIDKFTGKLLGYSGFWLLNGEAEAHITTLAVHPSHKRQSIGERLLVNDIFEAKRFGARWMTLEVRASNTKAQNLYQKYGFKTIGMRRKYYQDNGEDALVLWTDNIETPEFSALFQKRSSVLDLEGVFADRERLSDSVEL
jgi:ribosomal-protein-alanine N-acetyltransferase